jgi:hypothetical protein
MHLHLTLSLCVAALVGANPINWPKLFGSDRATAADVAELLRHPSDYTGFDKSTPTKSCFSHHSNPKQYTCDGKPNTFYTLKQVDALYEQVKALVPEALLTTRFFANGQLAEVLGAHHPYNISWWNIALGPGCSWKSLASPGTKVLTKGTLLDAMTPEQQQAIYKANQADCVRFQLKAKELPKSKCQDVRDDVEIAAYLDLRSAPRLS